ncbi:g5145 [Coccomyxa elongata]
MAHFVASSMAPKQERMGVSSRGVASPSRAPQPRTAAPPAEVVLADVQSVVESVLGAHVPADQPFMQAGLDSLGAVELRNALAAKFGVAVPATVAFDFPTAAALVGYVRASFVPSTEISARQEYKITPSGGSTTSFTAVCAIAARYPLPLGASPLDSAKSGADQFWHTLSTGANLPVTVPVSRWDIDDVYSPEPVAKNMYVRFGCFVDAVDEFDASAFRIASGEAVAMDPQARIALEQTQEAMHAAGGNADGEAAATGTYFGCMYTEYLDAILGPTGVADSNSAAITGHGLSFLVGRMAYTFGLSGPCVSTDTACSSSLVALHLAHQGLMTGETAAAAAGGVNVMLTPQTTARICLLQALSPVGRCKTFDESGDGYGRGEGFTVAYLRGGENATSGAMLALMRSSAVNQDGRSSSLTAPNGPSQQALVASCLLGAGIGAEAVRYVAVHGTGTPLGDPIEVGALGSALGRRGSEPGRLTLGSNKACYGHTEGTAGITGALLAITALRQAAAAPIVNLRSVNPYVTAALSDWRSLRRIAAHAPRQLAPGSLLKVDGLSSQVAAGTSSFGMSGVNAHALFSAPDLAPGDSSDESSKSPALTWRAERHWVAPAVQRLLRSFSWGAGGGTCSFSVDLSAPHLTYLLDHQVMERPLLPGAGLLEMAAAAGIALAGAKRDAVPILAQALISSPCQLSVGGGARKLTCTLHPGQGSVQIASAQLHLTGVLTQMLPAGRHEPELTPLKSSSLHNILAGQIDRFQGPMGKRQVAANVGVQGMPKQDAAGYGVHPALGDACIHLAAVPPAGQPILHVRVPVAVGARTGNASSGAKTGTCGFCVAQPDGGNTDGSTLNHMHWLAQGGSAQMQIRDLMAKVMAAPKPVPSAASNISYEVQWQALACAHNSLGKFSHIRRFSSQQGNLWELSGKENGAPVTRRSRGRQRPRESTPLESLRRAGIHAQRHLADLQSLLTASKSGGRLALATRGARSGDQSDLIYGASPARGLAEAPAWALLKVAAAEMDEKKWHMSGQSAGWAQQLHTDYDLSISGVDNIHGPAMSGGYWAAPKLLPVSEAPAPISTLHRSTPRNMLVSGGLGALGSLVAAWLTGQATSAHAPNLTLLGRSGRVADPNTRRILAESQTQASVTMAKCDVAFSADTEAVTSAQADLGCSAIDCIIHAGGVLKDALLANQNAHSMRQAFAAKASGAAQLAARSAGLLPVATGVAFSSIAGLLGSAGQGNYGAANAVLDEWSAVQSKQGMNAVSIQWGAWAGAGMAAHDHAILARLHRVGLGAIAPADGLAALHTALTGNAAPQMAAAVFKWDRLLVGERASMHFYAEFAAQTTPQNFVDHGEVETAAQSIASSVDGVSQEGQGEGGNASRLPWAGMQPVQRAAWVQAAISQAVSAVLGRPVGPEEPLTSAGLDSLGAVELRMELSHITTLDLPATLVFDYPSTGELTAALAAMLPEPPLPEQARAPAAKSGRKAGVAESAAESGAAERVRQIKAWRPPQRDDITAQVLAAVRTVMGADVSMEASLMSAGLDSLGAVELRKELASVTGLDLPTTLVFDYPSAESITDFIVSMLPTGPPPTDSTEVAASGEVQERAAVKRGGNRGTNVVDSGREFERPVLQDISGVIALVPDSEEDTRDRRWPRLPVNPGAPRLTKDDYFTVPDMRRLKRMHDDELKAVERFVIGRKDVGEVAFIDPVDLREVDLDAIIDMDKGHILVYGLPGGAPRPAQGEGLNRPALLTFRRMHVKQKSDNSIAKFRAKLMDHAAKLGGVFVHYDADTGNWIMKVDHF